MENGGTEGAPRGDGPSLKYCGMYYCGRATWTCRNAYFLSYFRFWGRGGAPT
jgi:hypothetical protein